MGQLRDVYPEYSDRVEIVGVGVDPSEEAKDILSYKEAQEFTWPMTTADVQMLKSYNVTRQAAHMALDSNGVVVSDLRYGSETASSWREVFESLLGS